jgi:hypothetical protein
MTEIEALQLIQRYATSYFDDRSANGWFDANELSQRTGGTQTIRQRAIGGSKVPLVKGQELTATMIENVEESREDVKLTGGRLQRARRDGLLDREAFAKLGKKTRAAWLGAVQVVKGDYQRAMAEMKHWQEYAELASEGRLPILKNPGANLIKQLAEMKAFEPDRRLPPEPETEENPF